MSGNERVQYDSGDIGHNQLASSQASRTQFTPGKATSRAGDQNWPKEFRIPTGTPAFDGEAAGPVEMSRSRVVKLGRGIVSDQTVLTPVVSGTRIETRIEEGINGANTTSDTVNPLRLSGRERNSGQDRVVGA
jgi:hypothetical protein